MTFTVKILGAGSATPLKGRHQSSQYVSVEDHKYLIDCGEGTQYRLIEEKINLNKIEAIFISHLHGDHFYGLVGLISTMSLLGRQTPLKVFCTPGFLDILTLTFKVSGTVLSYDLTIKEFIAEQKEQIYDDERITVSGFPLKHGLPANGYLVEEKPRPLKLVKEKIQDLRVEDMVKLKQGFDVQNEDGTIKFSVADYTMPPLPQRSYAYCSDTVYSEEISAFVKGVDLLYHEATYLEIHKDKAVKNRHATALEAALTAKNAGVKKLMIGHLSSRYDDYEAHLAEACAVFENTIPATEGRSVTL